MNVKTLSEVCNMLNITRRTIQGYEEYELLKPAGKNERGWLLYDDECIERIQLIKFYQKIGLERSEIADLLEAPQQVQIEILRRQHCKIHEEIDEKIELARKISKLIDTL